FGKEYENGHIVSGNIGLRYTNTNRISSGFQEFQLPTSIPNAADCMESINNALGGTGTVNVFCALSATERANYIAFANGALVANDYEASSDYWPPILSLRMEVADGRQFRAAYPKGIAPPDLALIRNYFPIALSVHARTNADGATIPIELT